VAGEATTLFETVVEGDYCIGCGACAAVPGAPIEMELDASGRYTPRLTGNGDGAGASVLAVCPFADEGEHEDEIGARLFGDGAEPHERIGFHMRTWAGHVAEDGYRAAGSSGGLGTWILVELLRRGTVDAVLHVRPRSPDADDSRLFAFDVSRQEDELRSRAKSRYYPVEMSEALAAVRDRPGRYAVVGVPCYVKAIRRLAAADPVIGERVRATLALICGHLKSTRFADSTAWQAGIEPGRLEAIDFRHKLPDAPANRYGVELRGRGPDGSDRHVVASREDFFGGNWGHGFFKYEACDYCDDVVGETADVTVGDAWLPQYVDDSGGTNVVVARTPEMAALIEAGIADGRLSLEPISADAVAESQDAGLRHRREGLSYRLLLKDRAGRWRPRKRVPAREDHLEPRQRRIYAWRIRLARESHRAFARALAKRDVSVFEREMTPLMRAHDLEYMPRWRALASRLKWFLQGRPGPARRAGVGE
jgi:coenzyme F420 hydrogenase subunit beta